MAGAPGRRNVHFALESAVPTVVLECKMHLSRAKSASNPAAAGTTAGAAMETPSESRGGGGTPGIQPCAWETTETKFIQMLKEGSVGYLS